eukprot:6492695-Amphidinium_carterae.3
MSVVEWIQKYAAVGAVLDKSATREMFRFCEEGKMTLRTLCANEVEALSDGVMLWQYSSDCTPVKVRAFLKGGSVGSRSSQMVNEEYLVQLLFLTVMRGDGDVKHRMYFSEPVCLQHGKQNTALLACSLSFLSAAWMRGSPEALKIYHQVHDRGLGQKYREAVSGHLHEFSECSELGSGDGESDHGLLELHTSLGCALHDLHNSLKWSYQSAGLGEKEQLDKLYQGIQAYRRGGSKAVSVIADWLAIVLVAAPPKQKNATRALEEFYTSLGMDGDVVSQLAHDMELEWQPSTGHMEVSSAFVERQGSIGELTCLLLGLWRFPTFVSSRWMTIGCSCRVLWQGYATGYSSFFKYMRRYGVVTQYDGSAGDNMDDDISVLSLLLGLVASVPESVMTMLVSDNRLLMHLDAVRDTVAVELEFILAISDSVWMRFGSFCNARGHILRHQVVRASLVAIAYMSRKIFEVAEGLPWDLALGDLETNLSELVSLPTPPEEVVSQKIWTLAAAGIPKARLLQCLRLLQCVSWTSHVTERLHASASVIRKRHPDYTSDTLRARAFLHSLSSPCQRLTDVKQEISIVMHSFGSKRFIANRNLFCVMSLVFQVVHKSRLLLPQQDLEDRWLHKVRQKISKLRRARPAYISGRQAYFRDMMRKSLLVNKSVSKRGFSQRRVMSAHGEQWRALSEAKKRHYEVVAETMRNERDLEIRARLADERERLLVQGEQGRTEKNLSKPGMQASSAALTPSDLEAFRVIHDANLCKPSELKALRERAQRCPLPLSATVYERLREKSSLQSESKEVATELVHALCRGRDALGSCVLGVHSAGSWSWYAFLHALQQPMTLFLLPLEWLPIMGPDIRSCTKREWMQNQYQQYTFHWSFECFSFAGASVFHEVDESDVYVIPSCEYRSGNFLVSRDEMQTLAVALPPSERAQHGTQTKERKPSVRVGSASSTEDRGLASFLQMTSAPPGPPKNTQSMSHEKEAAPHVHDSEEEQDSDSVHTHLGTTWTALEEARQAQADAGEAVDQDFYIRVDGGEWQQRRTGRQVYGIRVTAKQNTDMLAFLKQYKLPQSQAFENNKYTSHGGELLARLWRTHMFAYVSHWQSKGKPSMFPMSDMPVVDLTSDLREGIQSMTGELAKRRDTILALRPVG